MGVMKPQHVNQALQCSVLPVFAHVSLRHSTRKREAARVDVRVIVFFPPPPLFFFFFPLSPAKVSLSPSLSLSLSIMDSDNTQITGVVSQQQEGGVWGFGPCRVISSKRGN